MLLFVLFDELVVSGFHAKSRRNTGPYPFRSVFCSHVASKHMTSLHCPLVGLEWKRHILIHLFECLQSKTNQRTFASYLNLQDSHVLSQGETTNMKLSGKASVDDCFIISDSAISSHDLEQATSKQEQ